MFNGRRVMRRVFESAVLVAAMSVAPVCGAQEPTAPAPAATDAPPAAKAAWTLMVYLAADNNLERPMMDNLKDMARAGSTEQVNIIVLAARSPLGDKAKDRAEYTNEGVLNQPNWTTAKLFRVEQGKLLELPWNGGTDTGDAKTLENFVSRATQSFPAQHYALIFGDHGMAWGGVAVAANGNPFDHSLGMADITQALTNATKTTGPLDLVGFDACVMANLEVAKTVAPFARYLVASEEIEPAEGWNYTLLLNKLKVSPTMGGQELGTIIVDTYQNFFTDPKQPKKIQNKGKGITLSLIDLSKIPAVEQAVMAMGISTDELVKQAADFAKVADARFLAEEYGRSGQTSTAAQPGTEVYDIADLARHLREKAGGSPAVQAASKVSAAVGDAVIHKINGAGRPQANGLSIFFPPDRSSLAMGGSRQYKDTSFALSSAWYNPFLKDFAKVHESSAERSRPKPAIDALALSGPGRLGGANSKVHIESQAHGDDIDEANFVVAQHDHQENRIILGSIPVDLDANDDLDEEWDGKWFAITDQDVQLVAPITSFEELSKTSKDDLYWAEVPAQIMFEGSDEWVDVTLTFLLDFRGEEVTGDFVYAVEYTKYGPREIELDLEGGVDLRPMYTVIDAAGEEHLTPPSDDRHVLHVANVDDLKVGRSRLPAGTYQVGFVVEDVLGRNSESFVDVTLDDATLPESPAHEAPEPEEEMPAAPAHESPEQHEAPAHEDTTHEESVP